MSNLPTITETKEISSYEAREDEFIRCLAIYPSTKEAGIKAGYSESYSSSDICNKFKSERFLKKIRKFYNGSTHMLLPKIFRAESQVVDLVLEDPEKVSKHRHTLTEIKRSIGVLDQETTSKPPVIKIGNVKNLLLNAHSG